MIDWEKKAFERLKRKGVLNNGDCDNDVDANSNKTNYIIMAIIAIMIIKLMNLDDNNNYKDDKY